MTEPEDLERLASYYPSHSRAVGEPTDLEKRCDRLEKENSQLCETVQTLRCEVSRLNWELTLAKRRADAK